MRPQKPKPSNDKLIHLKDYQGSNHPSKVDAHGHSKRKQPDSQMWRRLIFGMTVGLMVLFSAWPVVQSYKQKSQLEEQYQSLQKDQEAAQKEYQEMEQMLEKTSDPSYIAELARRDYYYSKPGEVIFLMDDVEESTPFQSQAEDELGD